MKHSLIHDDLLGDEIDDSPIVDDDTGLTAILGVAYSFGK